MRLLLDTHALLWWLNDDDQLGPHARGLIEDPANDVFVSMVSLWEIAVKVRVGKLDADVSEILGAIPAKGFTLLDIAPAHLVALVGLPMHHRDPFDHLLIAQAISEGATFVSEDQYTPLYPVTFLTCSDAASPPTPG